MKYHIWTIGCQMNVADSQRMGSELERLGYEWSARAEDADVVVLNTCVVRQQAEDKIYGRLGSLKPLKDRADPPVIGLMGCFVGVKNPAPLRKRFPYVDVFIPPSEPKPLLDFLKAEKFDEIARQDEVHHVRRRHNLQDGDLLLPAHERGNLVSAHVPIIYGCNHVCAFCIIPHRRGTERSRSVGEIAREVRSLVAQGVREVTLLGQIVDRYGFDVPDGPDLADLLHVIHEIDGLERIRFLTSHPNYMHDGLLDTVAELPKVMEHIEVPIQAGDNEVLERMRRGYTREDYYALVHKIRDKVPGVAIHTDIIVGFPGETEEQFQKTYDALSDLKLDKAHVACYSPRPNTVSASAMEDDVPAAEKERRRRALDDLQEQIVGEINSRLLDQTVEILVEDQHKGKWRGRTHTNKLVFFKDDGDWQGKLVDVRITWAGPWSMQAKLVKHERSESEAHQSEVAPLATF
ncbi:MAG: tRNA-2-methylthio-N(6)-dimethylallyladenosine synthase [Anaerolineales bacterium]|nr:tRNA-2-methylthio-N(6)-dimethylallyladenosine synthase [Anaerolineales bacterium]